MTPKIFHVQQRPASVRIANIPRSTGPLRGNRSHRQAPEERPGYRTRSQASSISTIIFLGLLSSASGIAQTSGFTNLNWLTCAADSKVQCATTKVPLDWNNPTGPQIDYFVRLYPAPVQPAARAVIYVAGGPGSPGGGGAGLVDLQALLPDLDVVAPDHRGTGRSTWFGCDQNKPLADLSADCIQQLVGKYGPQAGSYFSATQAATDLGHLADSLHTSGKKVYIYGESYGTFLVNRYLNLYPSGVDAAILDGVSRPDGHGPFLPGPVDLPPNRVGHKVFDSCGSDAFCSGKLGTDPWAVLGALHKKLAAGFCSAAVQAGTSDPSSVLKNALFILSLTYPGAAQTALVYRLNRCSDADVAALEYFNTIAQTVGANFTLPNAALSDGSTPAMLSTNELLHLNIDLSDSFGLHPPLADLASASASAYVENVSLDQEFATAFDTWPLPLYDPGVARQWANTTIPVLLIEGSLDTKTPADVLGDAVTHFTSPHQQLVIVPNGTHVTFENSTATVSTMGHTCGSQIIGAFLAQPASDLKTQCTNEIPPLDFHGTADMAKTLFGTSDLYEDAAPAISAGGIANAASSQRIFAAGMIMSILGTNLSRGLAGASQLPLPATIGGTSVTVNEIAAPLYYVSTAQVNAQIPVDVQAGSATVAVTVNGKTSTQTITLTTTAPGIFANGRLLPGRPAKPGDEVAIYITGQGPLSPPVPTGSAPAAETPVDQLPQPSLSTGVTVGGEAAQILFIGVPTWAVGVTQINFLVPNSVPASPQPVVVTIGGQISTAATLLVAN